MRKTFVLFISILFATCVQLFATTVTVKISSPTNGASSASPVHVSASATASPSRAITGWWVYVDSVGVYQAGRTPSISTDLPMSSGTHKITVHAWSKGVLGSAEVSTTVSSPSSPVSVTISPTSASVQTGQSKQFSSTVSGTSNTAVTWLVNGTTGGSSSLGTVSSAGLYTAPTVVPTTPVTVTAKSYYDPTSSANAPVSVFAPSTAQFSGLTSSLIMMKGAGVSWTTATPMTSQVQYGTTAAYGSSTSLDSTSATGHSMTLLGLSPNTVYHYRAKGQDASGSTYYSDDATFTTALWSADHETGDLSNWTISGPSGSGGMFNSGTATGVASPDYAHTGTYSLKATISGSSAVRMFRWNETYQNPTMYYSAWYYFPQRYQATAGWWNIMQWKSVTQANNCNLSLSDPFYVLDVHNRADGTMYLRLYNWQKGFYTEQTLKNINVGQWVHVQAYYKSAGDNTGHVTIWQDGVQIIDLANVQTKYTGGCYAWSVDNYSGGLSPNPATIYADDVSISLNPQQ